ncbi:MAG: hypothetical protein AAB368_00535, partial [bacterium]
MKNIPIPLDVFLMRPAGTPYLAWTIKKRRRMLTLSAAGTALAVLVAVLGWFSLHRDVAINLAPTGLTLYAGLGASLYMDGANPDAITLHHRGTETPGAYMGMVLFRGGDLGGGDGSTFEGFKITLLSNPPETVDIVVVESSPKNPAASGEQWLATLPITNDPTEFVLPFAAFEKGPWQPVDQDGDGVLERERVLKVLIQPPASATVLTELIIKDLRLVRSRRSAPPEWFGALAGSANAAVGAEAKFSATVRSAHGVPVQCMFDWGDGTITRTPFAAPVKPVTVPHAWRTAGTYQIRARAMNVHGASTGWSNPVAITVAQRDLEGVIATFENKDDWYVFGVNGAVITMDKGEGRSGPALAVRVQRGGDWGAV